MKTASHIIPTVKVLLSGYQESHIERVIDAIRKGPRVSVMDLARLCKVSRSTIWLWISTGKIPRPRKDGRRLNTWDYSEVSHVM
jgi:predicted DNA-binding transcriptional regulator AlpA